MKQKKTLFLRKKYIFTWLGVFLFFSIIFGASFFIFSFFRDALSQVTTQKNKKEGIRYVDTIFPKINIQPNVEYSRIQNKKLLLDVYQPEGDVELQRAALIWIHGGGFFYGNKERMKIYAQKFAEKGFVSVSINYQLGEKDLGTQDGITTHSVLDFPIIIEAQHDAQTAVRWLKAHAYDYQVNPDLIFIGGESAGGIIALLVGYNFEDAPQREYKEYSPQVAGVISISGVSDPKIVVAHGPPALLFHGEEDPIIRFSDVKKFQKKLEEFQIPQTLYSYPGMGHILEKQTEDVLSKITQFLEEVISQ